MVLGSDIRWPDLVGFNVTRELDRRETVMKNFTNGALVFKIWRGDGSGEVLAKFQYMQDAKRWAEFYTQNADKSNSWFLTAVCESECEVATYLPVALD